MEREAADIAVHHLEAERTVAMNAVTVVIMRGIVAAKAVNAGLELVAVAVHVTIVHVPILDLAHIAVLGHDQVDRLLVILVLKKVVQSQPQDTIVTVDQTVAVKAIQSDLFHDLVLCPAHAMTIKTETKYKM